MTRRPNEKNERLKRQFIEFRKHSKQLSEKSLDKELATLERFDVWNKRREFAGFHVEWAMGFRKHLELCRTANGKPLAKSTMLAIMATMREFIFWLSQQDGYRSKIKIAHAEYFHLSRRDEAEARASPARPAPSINQAKHTLAMMPEAAPRDLRDKAVVALLCLTGIRVAALVSLRIKHIDLTEQSVTQNPREVATKRGNAIDTFFAKNFEEAEAALTNWVRYLDEVALYGPDDPLFPATALATRSTTGFSANGFACRHWKSTEPVRKIVRTAFERAGKRNYGPHAFRHMLARHAVNTAESVAEIVANAQNLGHSDVLTTLRSYGQLSRERQRELITGKKGEN